MQNHLCCCMSSMSPIITLGTTMLSNLQPLTDGCKASWAGLVSTVGIDFSKVHPTLPTNPCSQKASGTDRLDSIVTTTYHWVPRTLDNTCTCLTTKPSGMGPLNGTHLFRCKVMSTFPTQHPTVLPLELILGWRNSWQQLTVFF